MQAFSAHSLPAALCTRAWPTSSGWPLDRGCSARQAQPARRGSVRAAAGLHSKSTAEDVLQGTPGRAPATTAPASGWPSVAARAGRDLTGKTALITGAGQRGLGFEAARALAQAGCRVLFTCRTADSGQPLIRAAGQVHVATTRIWLEGLCLCRCSALPAAMRRPSDAGWPLNMGPAQERVQCLQARAGVHGQRGQPRRGRPGAGREAGLPGAPLQGRLPLHRAAAALPSATLEPCLCVGISLLWHLNSMMAPSQREGRSPLAPFPACCWSMPSSAATPCSSRPGLPRRSCRPAWAGRPTRSRPTALSAASRAAMWATSSWCRACCRGC